MEVNATTSKKYMRNEGNSEVIVHILNCLKSCLREFCLQYTDIAEAKA